MTIQDFVYQADGLRSKTRLMSFRSGMRHCQDTDCNVSPPFALFVESSRIIRA